MSRHMGNPIDTFISAIRCNLAEFWDHACNNIVSMYADMCACVIFCDQPCPPCVPDLIRYFGLSDLTQFVCACKNIVCIQANLCALVQLCAQICPACSPDSIDTLISLIKRTQVQSVHVCYLVCLGQIMYSGRSSMFSWFHRYFYLSHLTQFGQDMGLCMQEHSMHAC